MRQYRAAVPHTRFTQVFARILTAVGVERFATYTGWPVWFVMGYMAYNQHSVVEVFFAGLALEIAHAMMMLEIYLWGMRRGYDVTGVRDIVDHLRSPIRDRPAGVLKGFWWNLENLYKRLGKATVDSYWLLIVVGSNVFLGTDYVTLILRAKGEDRVTVFFRVMLPAGVASTAVGTLIVWGGFEGLWWAEIL